MSKFEDLIEMSDELKNVLLQSNKITDSEKWDAEYDSLSVGEIAESLPQI